MTTHRIRLAIAANVLLAGLMSAAGCAHSATAANRTPAAAGQTPATAQATNSTGPLDGPSASARMICQPEAVAEIAAALGVQTSTPPTATWSGQVYSCRYVYPTGVMLLSIKELPDQATTTADFTAAQQSLTSHTPIQVLGQNGFAGPDGSLYVRKDFKILHVDVSQLPDHIGEPPYTRADAAFTVAAVIMSCWTGN